MARRERTSKIDRWLDAAGAGDTAAVIDYLSCGMDVNTGCEYTNTTALMRAVRDGRVEMVRFLLERGADLSPENSLGYTAITYAVLRSRTWDGYRDNPQPDPRPLEILLAAGGHYRLREAVLLNDVELARRRLDEGADADTGEWTYHGPLLKIAAELGYLEIVDLLLDRGANIEATDDIGQRPLLSAARYGRTEVVRRLLDRGADIDAVGWSDESALSNATIEGHWDVADLLLSKGARRRVVDALATNDMALFASLLDDELRSCADVDRLSDGRFRVAVLAAARGNVEALSLLLDRGAAQLQDRRDHRSLLAEAAAHGHIAAVRLLIERGADLHAAGRDGLTPLALALEAGHDEVAAVLRIAGAQH